MGKIVNPENTLQETLKALADIKYALDVSTIVAITDQKGNIIFANDAFCKISKYSREELIGKNHRIINSGLHSKDFFRNLWRTIAQGKVWRGEIRNKAKDGSFYWVDTTIVPFLNEKKKPYQYVSIRHEITQRKLMEEEINAIPQRIIQAQESECNRIARDIHDDLGQSLATLKMLIQSVTMAVAVGESQYDKESQKIVAYLNEIIEKSRNLAMRLRPSTLEALGLTTSLKSMFSEINHTKRLKVLFRHTPLDRLVFKADSINVFRIAQEALGNILKHASASEVKVTARYMKGNLVIKIIDNGKGFEVSKKTTGMGLLTMKERVALLKGDMQIESSSKKGTTIVVNIPAVLKE